MPEVRTPRLPNPILGANPTWAMPGLFFCSVSAASQAITTFIRAHTHRCDVEQDHPLLLRHVLSGTPSDDDLLPALHSLSGGAHCNLPPGDNRRTNFRKGTMVWYLSKAAGAPCPFGRAGIRLCDYGENGKVGYMPATDREKKRERDRARRAANRGLKRKRLPRACADKGTASDSESEAEKPPPKVKLTLRLKPSDIRASLSPSSLSPPASTPHRSREIVDMSRPSMSDSDEGSGSDESSLDSDEDSVSVASAADSHPTPETQQMEMEQPWSLTGYPRVRATSMPPFTLSSDGQCLSFSLPTPAESLEPISSFRRSTSVTHSDASPPPDSDDEKHVDANDWTSAGARRYSSAEEPPMSEDDDMDADWGFDEDEESDIETRWEESPAPLSPPSSGEVDDVVVKQEPGDLAGMSSAWEALDERSKVVEVVIQAAAGQFTSVKTEEFDTLEWEYRNTDSPSWLLDDDDTALVKDEDDIEPDSYFADVSYTAGDGVRRSSSPSFDFTALTLNSPVSPTVLPRFPFAEHQPGELQWTNVQLLGPDTVEEREFDDRVWNFGRRPALTVSDTEQTIVPTTPVEIPQSAIPVPSSESDAASPRLAAMPSLSSSVGSLDSPEILTDSQSFPFFRPGALSLISNAEASQGSYHTGYL
jgi:hypothetical protein